MSKPNTRPEPLQTGARQTMAAWSKVLNSLEEAPEPYRQALRPLIDPSQDFPHLVLAPALDKFPLKSKEKLICDSPEAIHILERSGGQGIIHSYPYQSVSQVEVGVILLKSWLSLGGKTSAGPFAQSTIEFNTSSERHYTLFLQKLRPAALPNDPARLELEQAKLDFLADQSFKFMNYGRNSLLAGETLLQSLFQPEISQPAWQLAGWTLRRTVSLAHLTLLTDKELILIRDDERSQQVRGKRYGGIWQYIPRASLRSVTLEETGPGLLGLDFQLDSGLYLRRIFSAARQAELETLRATLSPGSH